MLVRSLTEERMMSSPHVCPRVSTLQGKALWLAQGKARQGMALWLARAGRRGARSTLPLYMASPRCTMLSSPVGTSSLGAKRRICSAREMSNLKPSLVECRNQTRCVQRALHQMTTSVGLG